MITIRNGCFETNSSSVHTFAIPNDSIPLNIPKVIDLNKRYSEDEPEYRIQMLFDSYLFDPQEIRKLVDYLITKGITVIGLAEDDEMPSQDIFKNTEQLDKFLFGEGVIETYSYSEGDRKPIEKPDPDSENYDFIHLNW